jgi:uncharacterized protein YkwD
MQVVRIPPPSADHPEPAPGTAAGSWAEQEHEVLVAANRRRASARLPPLAEHPAVAALAREHSEAMARGARPFGHGGFQRRSEAAREALLPERDGLRRNRLHEITYDSWAVAENVAQLPVRAAALAAGTVTGWMESAGHRANLLGEFDLAGTGVALASDGSFYVTQIYVRTPR